MIDIPNRIVAVFWIDASQDLYRGPVETGISHGTPLNDLLAGHSIVQGIGEMGGSVVVSFLIRRWPFHPSALIVTFSRGVVNPCGVDVVAMGTSYDVDVVNVEVPSFIRR
jgi:hypothetical protein